MVRIALRSVICSTPMCAQPLGTRSVVVLADDDREYKPTALSLLEKAMLRPFPSSDLAFSYTTYTLPGAPGCSHAAHHAWHLLRHLASDACADGSGVLEWFTALPSGTQISVGQGADLFAIPMEALATRASVERYFQVLVLVLVLCCCCAAAVLLLCCCTAAVLGWRLRQ